MRRISLVTRSAASALLVFGLICTFNTAKADTAAEARRLLSDYCVKCHGAEKQKGKVRLDDLTGDITMEGSRWTLLLEQVRSGEMPPDDEKQPTAAERKALEKWVVGQLGAHAQRRPNLGNLVPHDLLFAPESAALAGAPAPRHWRISGGSYERMLRDLRADGVKGIVAPFSSGAERGLKDFAGLSRMDEPTMEILLRNATLIVESQTAHKIENGKVQPRNDTVREFTDLMDPALTPAPEQLEKAVQKQFAMAIGRKAAADEVQRFRALYDECAAGGDRPGAVKAMLAAVLLQTDVIFRSELGGPDGRLTSMEAARAIGATLLHGKDEPLLRAAAEGRLATREQVAAEVRRILDDPNIAKPRLRGFFREYLEYGNATEVFKDEPKDLWHRPEQHVKDTDRLVDFLLAEDKDIFRRMLLTPLAFANVKSATNKETRREELQRALIPNAHNQRGMALPESLYGLAEWTALQPVTQPARTRIGLLMQPSWLMGWSENFNNDIVRRGRFIRERLLGGTVPDLPIGVAAVLSQDKTRTLRDRVASATKADACWRCHQHMDSLGLPFEQFDHYGRLMATDLVLDPEATEKNKDYKGKPLGDVFRPVPLDTTGAITGTGDPKLDGPVQDPYEMMERIANSDRARQVWIRHVFRYYLGRNETLADAATLQAADRAYLESGGSFKTLLVSLLTSDSFLKHRTTTAPAAPMKT